MAPLKKASIPKGPDRALDDQDEDDDKDAGTSRGSHEKGEQRKGKKGGKGRENKGRGRGSGSGWKKTWADRRTYGAFLAISSDGMPTGILNASKAKELL